MNRKMNKRILGLFICAMASLYILSLPSMGATAPAFPDKPVSILCIYSAGGSTDLTARMIGNSATESMGQPVIVMNRVGGGGYLGLSQVYNANPDGYTLGVLASSGLVLGPHIRKPPFDHLKLTSIMSYGFYNMMLAVKADAPWKTMKEFIEYMKKNPGKAKIACASPIMMSNIPLWMLQSEEKIDFKLVPFGGSGPATVAALGGHTDAATVAGEAVPYILDGRMRGLCVYGAERFPKLPDVPTLKEVGYPDIVVESRAVIVGTPGIPKDTVKILEENFKKALDDKGFQKVMKTFDMTPSFLSSEGTDKYLRDLSDKIRATLVNIGKIKQ